MAKATLNNIFPDHPKLDGQYAALRNAEVSGYRALSPQSTKGSDTADLGSGQFGIAVIFSAFVFPKTFFPRTSLILGPSNPFQILKSVVSSVAINVVDLLKVVGIGKKSLGHEPVHCRVNSASVALVQMYRWVSLVIKERRLISNSSNPPKIGDFVEGTSLYSTPFLGCHWGILPQKTSETIEVATRG